MSNVIDQHAINHMIVATKREMTPKGRKGPVDANTLFMGGSLPTRAEQTDLANFGLRKNYNMVFLSFDPASPQDGPIGIHAVATDGLTQAITMQDGRLWKRDRSSPAILVFAELETTVRLNSKGHFTLRHTVAKRHDHGYDLALDAIRARASRKPGTNACISSIGSLITVFDLQQVVDSFAMAE